jgi:hypothetical protein
MRIAIPAVTALTLVLASVASAQPPPAPPPVTEGVVGQAAVAAGNLASARERALDDAFRQLVERGFAELLSEAAAGATPNVPANLASLRAAWIARPKRLVRSYRVLEQGEVDGTFRVRVTAELDAAHMRREFDRARGSANKGVTPGAVPVVGSGPPEAPAALASALTAEGVRAQHQLGATDDAGLRAFAARSGRGVVVAVTGRSASEGLVRGTSEQSVECQMTVRLLGADGSSKASERSAGGRAFGSAEAEARAACFARATRDLLPALLPDLGSLTGGSGDLPVVVLDLDINEPAVISPVLRALRKIAGPSAAEVRRVIVGRVEIRVRSRLAPASLLNALTRELAALATVTRTGQAAADRLEAQVRLVAVAAPEPSLGIQQTVPFQP